jgi:hypothetical protein
MFEKIVNYRDDLHRYSCEGEEYISATTLIAFYKDYDTEFWSFYKAIQYTLGIKDYEKKKFSGMCRDYGINWKELSYLPLFAIMTKFDIPREKITAEQVRVKEMWGIKAKRATDKGTLYHDRKEQEALDSGKDVIGVREALTQYVYSYDLRELLDGFHPEVMLPLHEHKVAGRGDKNLIETTAFGRYVDLDDYKTSKTIDKKSFMNKKMKFPLNDLDDCNLNHYAMQLSLYGYTWEQYGFNVRDLKLSHQLVDDKGEEIGKTKEYDLPYLKNQVIKMLTHHGVKYRKTGKYWG